MVRHVWPDAPIESYNDALACVLDHCSPDPARRSVLVAHQFVAGAASCESEEPSVGGIDWVDAALFDKFDYVRWASAQPPEGGPGHPALLRNAAEVFFLRRAASTRA